MYPDAYTPAAAGAPTFTSGGDVTATNWRKMQLQGCVLLPCAGYRTVDGPIKYVGEWIRYWVYSTSYVRTLKVGTATLYYYRCLGGTWSGYTINTNAEALGRISTTSTDERVSVRLVHNL